MADTLRDLAVWYPFLPTEAKIPDAVPHILDIKVCITIPAIDVRRLSNIVNGSLFSVYVSSLSDTNCTVLYQSPIAELNGTLNIPVHVGRDSRPEFGESYVVVAQPVSYSGDRLQLHPDCLVFMQLSPSITLHDRTHVSVVDSYETDGNMKSPKLFRFANSLTLCDGYNVKVSMSDGSAAVVGASGKGLGLYRTPPYIEDGLNYSKTVYGLNTINGITTDVTISGSTVVSVSDSSNTPGTVDTVLTPVLNL